MKMLKKVTALVLLLISLVGVFTTGASVASAATSSTLATKIKSLCPIICYAMPANGSSRVYAYSDASLTNKQSGYYVDSFKEQIVVTDASSDGKAVKVRYLSGKGSHRDKWFRTDDVLGLASVAINDFQATKSMTVYRMQAASSVKSYGTVSSGSDLCYRLGSRKVGGTAYNTVVYKLSNASTVNGITARHKMGLVTQSAYNSSAKTGNSNQSSNFSPVWPTKNSRYISTMYRYWNGGNPKNHKVRTNIYNAFDIAGKSGDEIYAVEKGKVVDRGYQSGGFGYYVIIDHGNGIYTLYGHLKKTASVSKGQTVTRKQIIGYMGNTGNSNGDHLHFEMYNPNNKSSIINPWVKYYQGKISVTIGGNSYKANSRYPSDSYAKGWCDWLRNSCTKNSAGDYVFKK